ncbi:ABC transporter substrate-binding protein [Acidimangrovimonas sediminis]|uniref:ABC transporter substrate-binding protein n=1 Tax=Acidimangrovimonas sediminis TaxID=2056283 RepID=UPI000C7FB258|nr:sugar ABC transporter substrate-binding protein [Acidimangrovimonas sediminis]
MTVRFRALMGACAVGMFATGAATGAMAETTITVATVNNGDMIRMQGLTSEFEKAHPDIKVKWVTMEENVLRQKVTTDVATHAGNYDVMTIGNYEVPIWAKQGWLLPLNFPDSYDTKDILPAIRGALTLKDKLYAAPFYGESSMTMYRTDLMKKAGLEMPEKPTWAFIAKAAKAMTDKSAGVYGICLRGKAGWGENMAILTAMSNSFGARWFNEKWQPQFDSAAWKDTMSSYLDLMKNYGPPGASSNGFNENLALFQQGKCGIWIDATVAASFVTDPKNSKVAKDVGFAMAPHKDGVSKDANWLWSWNLAIPAGTKKEKAAETFIEWATSKKYTELVASKDGWANVPPGTRTSLYKNPEYAKIPFAKMTLKSIDAADATHPTVDPVPYTGVQFVAIPEFQGIGTAVGQQFSAALAGSETGEQALQNAQSLTTREMTKAGYIK